jgi:hypothetical protein
LFYENDLPPLIAGYLGNESDVNRKVPDLEKAINGLLGGIFS